MFGRERAEPCPGCTHFLDGLDGAALPVGGAFVGKMEMFEVTVQVPLHARQPAERRRWLPQA
jgi:predicted dithiol-disulfide oxidoreductase (DUF899 family)